MRIRLIGALLVLMFLASACNLGAAGDNEEQDLPTQEIPSGRPIIEITSPQENDQFAVDEQVFVRIIARDEVGVTRAQLFVNDEIVRTISSEAIEGELEFEGVLDYTPRTVGDFTLRVVAFRGAIPSDPDEVMIIVSETVDEIVVTSRGDTGVVGQGGGVVGGSDTKGDTSGGSGQPYIPNDGVCRALTSVGLNMRNAPTTASDNVIFVLPSGTLAPIIARLGDNSWWKLSYNNRVGWVSAQFTTIYGICTNVPVENYIVNTPTPLPTWTPSRTPLPTATNMPVNTPAPGLPDLIITSIVDDEDVVILFGETEVTEEFAVTVTNLGFGPSGQFEVVMFVNTDQYNLGVVSNLNRSESIILTQDIIFDAVGSYNIRVEADPTNAVAEVSNVNNQGNITVQVIDE